MAQVDTKKKAPKKPRGIVHIRVEQCKGCGFCIEFCPTNVLEFSKSYNAKGYHPPVVVDADACSGCMLCEMLCPDFAIFVTKIKKAKK
jgi:2-oxoglutarate ferredoxin oxidoreductase subunit delta